MKNTILFLLLGLVPSVQAEDRLICFDPDITTAHYTVSYSYETGDSVASLPCLRVEGIR